MAFVPDLPNPKSESLGFSSCDYSKFRVSDSHNTVRSITDCAENPISSKREARSEVSVLEREHERQSYSDTISSTHDFASGMASVSVNLPR